MAQRQGWCLSTLAALTPNEDTAESDSYWAGSHSIRKLLANIKTISGVNDSMLGTDSAEVSGIAIQAKQNRGAIMIQVPLDNLRKSRQYLAENSKPNTDVLYTSNALSK